MAPPDVAAQLKELQERLAAAESKIERLQEEADTQPRTGPNRLVLCFDGTGNQYMATEKDTNIVRIYQMLDRETTSQYHYYQPGIGTYVANSDLNNTSTDTGVLAGLKGGVQKLRDSMFGDSFADHVIAGYKFLMRYHSPGDKIYIFGFSRGAYTARFLCELLGQIGLLSRGNEEMVPFIWYQYADYQANSQTNRKAELEAKIQSMKKTFCRAEVSVHFLGLFDCVNSVKQFSIPLFGKKSPYVPGTSATHVRHAVALHERRAKFKPALFLLEGDRHCDSLEEMWFAGNHGDVGGGWEYQATDPQMLLSEFALEWMVTEVQKVDKSSDGESVLQWHTDQVQEMRERVKKLSEQLTKEPGKLRNKLSHDMLAWNRGSEWYMWAVWWFIEYLPLRYYNLENHEWKSRHGWNLGAGRDIPHKAKYHDTVELLHKSGVIPSVPLRGEQDPFSWRNLWGLVSGKKKSPVTNGVQVENGTHNA